jgi:hypothetical protein
MPVFHDGGSLAGNESRSVSSITRSAVRWRCRAPTPSASSAAPTITGRIAKAMPFWHSMDLLEYGTMIPPLWVRLTFSCDPATHLCSPAEEHDEQHCDDGRRDRRRRRVARSTPQNVVRRSRRVIARTSRRRRGYRMSPELSPTESLLQSAGTPRRRPQSFVPSEADARVPPSRRARQSGACTAPPPPSWRRQNPGLHTDSCQTHPLVRHARATRSIAIRCAASRSDTPSVFARSWTSWNARAHPRVEFMKHFFAAPVVVCVALDDPSRPTTTHRRFCRLAAQTAGRHADRHCRIPECSP